jgi:hypothetical protein
MRAQHPGDNGKPQRTGPYSRPGAQDGSRVRAAPTLGSYECTKRRVPCRVPCRPSVHSWPKKCPGKPSWLVSRRSSSSGRRRASPACLRGLGGGAQGPSVPGLGGGALGPWVPGLGRARERRPVLGAPPPCRVKPELPSVHLFCRDRPFSPPRHASRGWSRVGTPSRRDRTLVRHFFLRTLARHFFLRRIGKLVNP